VRRCLAKLPDQRWDGAHDVADELRWIAQGGPAAAGAPAVPPVRRRLWLLMAGGLAVAVVSGVVGVLLGGRWTTGERQRTMVVRPLLDVSPAEELNAGGFSSTWLPTPGGSRTALAWTPDGRSLVFVGRRGGVQQLYVRDLDGDEARPLEGTEEAQGTVVSPDGQSVAFWADRAIRRVPLAGGPVSRPRQRPPHDPRRPGVGRRRAALLWWSARADLVGRGRARARRRHHEARGRALPCPAARPA
jgi:hypothetical protein